MNPCTRAAQKHPQFRVGQHQRDWERVLFGIKRNTGWSWEKIGDHMGVGDHVLAGLRSGSEPTHSLGEFLLQWERVTQEAAAKLAEAPRAVEYHA